MTSRDDVNALVNAIGQLLHGKNLTEAILATGIILAKLTARHGVENPSAMVSELYQDETHALHPTNGDMN